MTQHNFLNHWESLQKQIYQENNSPDHIKAAQEIVREFCLDMEIESVIELGCGQAPVLDEFKKLGKRTLGVTLGGESLDHEVVREDMHFTKIAGQTADLVVARHALEHSPMPLILLMEMARMSRRYALVVVPVPDSRMINHSNHYSVFPKENWEWLFKLSGWQILKFKQADFSVELDYTYKEYRYLLEKI